jgi:uncharacterized membrane protein
MSYETLKIIHLFGVIILLGNIIVTAWWKIMANRTHNPIIISFAQRQVTLTDFTFTLPGAILIIAAGDFMSFRITENTWDIAWILWGRIVFFITGLIWLFILLPIQFKQAKIAKTFTKDSPIPEQYWKLCQLWYVFGSIAVLLPLINIYLMVTKPM